MSLGDKFQNFFYLFFKIHFWPRQISATYPPTYKGGIQNLKIYQFKKIYFHHTVIIPSTYKHASKNAFCSNFTIYLQKIHNNHVF